MPSTIVHMSLAAIIACALIPLNKFSIKSLLIVVFSVAFLDSDAFAYVIKEGLHRALFHNIVIPTVVLFVIIYLANYTSRDIFVRFADKSYINVICITTYIAVIFAGIGLDFADTGINYLWPIHDQFYTLEGKFIISSEKGVVQTFIDSPFESFTDEPSSSNSRNTQNFVYNTPVNPSSGSQDTSPERVFPIAYKGWQMILISTSFIVVSVKFLQSKYYNN